MFNFFRKNKKPKTTSTPAKIAAPIATKPDWLDYMDQEQFKHFMSAIDDYFTEVNLAYTHDDGVLKVEENDLGFANLGLSNVSQRCAQRDMSEYKSVVYDHFDGMQKIHKFNSNFDQTEKEFASVKDYISVRLMSSDSIGAIGVENVLHRRLSDEVIAMVVYDLPESTQNVKPNILKTWGKSEAEIFDLALANCQAQYPFEPKTHDFEGAKVHVLHTDHFFCTSIVLYPDEMQKYTSEHGALLIVPTRHLAMIYPIETLEVVEVVRTFIAIASGSFRDGPGSLTADMYWYHNGTLTNLPYSLGEELKFSPPEKFVELLNFLPGKPQVQEKTQGPVILPRIKADYNHEIYKKDSGPFLGNPLPDDIKIGDQFLPIIMPFTADLTILFAIDTGDQYTILNQDFLSKNPDLTLEELKQNAIQNLVKEIGEKIQIQGDLSNRCMLTCGGNFEAALLLLDFWDQLHDGMGDEIYIALPTRDVLLATKINDDNKATLLHSIKGYFDKNSDFLTSKALYVKTRGSRDLKIVETAF